MITITQFSGPLNGQSRQFSDAETRIGFGRNAICGGVDLEDKKTGGARHFALARDLVAERNQQIKSVDLLHLGAGHRPRAGVSVAHAGDRVSREVSF